MKLYLNIVCQIVYMIQFFIWYNFSELALRFSTLQMCISFSQPRRFHFFPFWLKFWTNRFSMWFQSFFLMNASIWILQEPWFSPTSVSIALFKLILKSAVTSFSYSWINLLTFSLAIKLQYNLSTFLILLIFFILIYSEFY